jgi:protein TonB
MENSAQAEIEERKNRLIAGVISLGITVLILLFFILFQIVTPNPPFEFSGEGGMEVNFGTYNEGTGNIENTGIGEATSVVAEATKTNTSSDNIKDEVYTSENGEPVNMENSTKPKIENNTTVITPVKPNEPVKPKEDKSNSNLLNAYKNNTGKNPGGDGNSGHSGNSGDPNGNPNTDGLGGTGNNPNFNGNGPGMGTNGTGINLAGRKIVTPPCKVNDSKEEGIVVVNITVDKQGNVKEADPNGRGTNTSSSVLKSKARQAALCAKFNPSDKFDEQTGTMVFKFEF